MTPENCETCGGTGEIDETLGGISTSNPHAPCPDCAGWRAVSERSPMFNCGYDPSCAGWVIREGSTKGEHIATCRTEALANEFVKLFKRSSPQHRAEGQK
jgi:hypothetical protein